MTDNTADKKTLSGLDQLRKTFNIIAEVLPGGPKKFQLLKNDSIQDTQSGDYMIGEKRELFRIQALVDIPAHGVKAGDIGGYVERERCLSHRGDSWVGGDARVFSQARVRDDALVTDNARIAYRAVVEDGAKVGGHSNISQWASVGGRAEVTGNSTLSWHSRAEGTAKLESASLLMHTRISSGTVSGEQPLTPADRKDMDNRLKTDPVYARISKGLVSSSPRS